MYPISYDADAVLDGHNRLTTFFRGIVVIPWQIVQYFYGIAAQGAAIIARFAILFTGRLSEGLFNPIRAAEAYLARATGYFLLLTEEWPPFSYEEGAAAAAGEISREAASRRS